MRTVQFQIILRLRSAYSTVPNRHIGTKTSLQMPNISKLSANAYAQLQSPNILAVRTLGIAKPPHPVQYTKKGPSKGVYELAWALMSMEQAGSRPQPVVRPS